MRLFVNIPLPENLNAVAAVDARWRVVSFSLTLSL